MGLVRFEEVSLSRTKRWVENGKKRQQTKKVWQTINPFNKNADGSIKTREQIYDELRAELDNWMKEPKS